MLGRIIKTVGAVYLWSWGLYCMPNFLEKIIDKTAYKAAYGTGLAILGTVWSIGEYKLIQRIWRDNEEDAAVRPLGLASTDDHISSKEISNTVE